MTRLKTGNKIEDIYNVGVCEREAICLPFAVVAVGSASLCMSL
jgi:hypothetical protein